MTTQTSIRHVSDTAFWVAWHRATETKRSDALFRDPFAEILCGERGKQISESLKQTSQYSFWTLSVRTYLIDKLIEEYIASGGRYIINIGAGLDARPYRMTLPQDLQWFELDFDDVIKYKSQRLTSYAARSDLQRIAVDVSNKESLEQVLSDLNSKVNNAFILTEGVVPYLTERQVGDLADTLLHKSNFKFWLTDFYTPQIYRRFQSPAFRKQMGSAPFQFFPENILEFYKQHGWKHKQVDYLYDVGRSVRRNFPLPWWAHPLKLLAGEKKFSENLRLTGYVLLEK